MNQCKGTVAFQRMLPSRQTLQYCLLNKQKQVVQYPNLVLEHRNRAISGVADFVDTTEERVQGILDGTVSPAQFEKERMSQYYDAPIGYLFFPRVVQIMRPDKYQHREKIRQKISQAQQILQTAEKHPGSLAYNSFAIQYCEWAIEILQKGTTAPLYYADYRRASNYILFAMSDYRQKINRAQELEDRAVRVAERIKAEQSC